MPELNTAAAVASVNGAEKLLTLGFLFLTLDQIAAYAGKKRSAVTALTISSGAVNIDCALGRDFTLTLTESVTSITFSNLNGNGFSTEIEVEIKQDATGSRAVTLPTSFKALGSSDVSVASAANSVTVISAKTFDNGTTWRYAMQESA